MPLHGKIGGCVDPEKTLKPGSTKSPNIPSSLHDFLTYGLASTQGESWKNNPRAEPSLEVSLTPVLDPPWAKCWVWWNISPAKKDNSSMEHPNIMENTEIWLPSNFCGAATSVLVYLGFFFQLLMASSAPKISDLANLASRNNLEKNPSFWANLLLEFSISLRVLWRVTTQLFVTPSSSANSVMIAPAPACYIPDLGILN